MDNRLLDLFLQLLRSGLWQKSSIALDQKLTFQEWTQIYQLACIHTVEGIIYDSFSFLDEAQLPPHTLRMQWTVRVDQIERHNAKMNAVIAKQQQIFTRSGLKPILQKGQGVAACYAKPEHRVCGDIDWYFENNGYAQARELLKQKKHPFKDTAGFSLDYDFNGIAIEHHKLLFDIRSPLKYKYLNDLQDKYRNKKQSQLINGVPVTILAPELHILQVNIHILKHMISFGIGFRQICDAARLYNRYNGKIDKQALYEMYNKVGILKWIHLLHQILEKYIGLIKEDIPFEYPADTQSNWMLNEIWQGGNFGYYDDRFVNGKTIKTISVHPDGAKRLWNNFKRYYPYAPQEAVFFPIIKLYSKFIGIDRD
ncbi:hypothetical protein SF1_01720 [Sphingobacterium faecium NBRC 15299]|uniref:nucleotidyltransferase family protein n=1 Tax=Sphingobacterium faecium TaxID=34087 RepID=UPI000D399D1D|nr:nucleotidyltransferase family protein [Sphingobacterium faecium]PTX12481.1 putative nucleotidyltransferase-like protein [Sphingobacterium faecium]GEM62190.1 hypothetical protein SF1_01720 [Sphingobacterium faecium NBRC 15299]